MRSKLAKLITWSTIILFSFLRLFINEKYLIDWKPIHLCWWFIKHQFRIPPYFIGKAVFTPTQDEYRFAEDGTIGSETLLGTQSTSFDRTITGDNLIWLRVQIQETGGANGGVGDDWQLQVQNGALGYNNVTATSTYIKSGDGTPADGASVDASRLTGGANTFVTGGYDEGDGQVDNIRITASNYTELIWSLTIVYNDVADNDSLTFRVLYNGSTFTYNVTPTLTIDKQSPPAVTTAGWRSTTGVGS